MAIIAKASVIVMKVIRPIALGMESAFARMAFMEDTVNEVRLRKNNCSLIK